MPDIVQTSEQDSLIYEFGSYFESLGFQPIAGRIIGLLSVSDKEELSFDEITDKLGISKGSASIILRNLQTNGCIVSVAVNGERRHYYKLNQQNMFRILDEFDNMCNNVRRLLNSALECKANKQSSNSVFFQKVIRSIDFYKNNLAELKQDFATENIK